MKVDTYQIITDRIIAQLEKGTIPWAKPWKGGDQAARNLESNKPYRGINALVLNCADYGSPYWLTFKQAQERGGHILKGEKGTPIVFWKFTDREVIKDGETEIKTSAFLRYYTVFNLQQTEGVKLPKRAEGEKIDDLGDIISAEKIISDAPDLPEILHDKKNAYYTPKKDYIGLPSKNSFISPEAYYSTLFHEVIHSTGHSSRLNRQGIRDRDKQAAYNQAEYSKEELVAEVGATFLCSIAGIENAVIDNSAAYIQGWLKALKNDRRLVISAAGQAQKAADYTLGKTV